MTPREPAFAGGRPGTVLMCPGQGAYLPGALRHLYGIPAVRRVLNTVDARPRGPGDTTPRVSRLLTDQGAPGPEELMACHPLAFDLATYAAVVASAGVVIYHLRTPVDAVLGHSVGDLAALTVAGAITVRQGVRLLCARDRMLRCAALPAGGLLATDMSAARTAELLGSCSVPQVRVAAHNAPAQVVLAGPDRELAAVREAARARGHRATPLTSRTAFHHPLLDEVDRAFHRLLCRHPLRPPALALYTAASDRRAQTPRQLRAAAAAHLTEPMTFSRTLRTLRGAGYTTFIDSGPRALLSTLAKANLPDCRTAAPLRTPADAERMRHRLGSLCPDPRC
ncbi:acyltransferase domain-containing protein [Streptomyces sp. TRM S81-3]|uniref:[acyl-carrier-protein] S-malonyltransferase n=2 Tax=Streptomyces griseicoloratus TaxID=2752516 RepID=A0A926LAG1_9ACTN|nr:acyltransferase domain-containing protein [Streptomyces griseicoloratus]